MKLYIIYRLKGKGLNLIKDQVSEDILKRSYTHSDIVSEYMREKGISWSELKGEPQLEFPTNEEE